MSSIHLALPPSGPLADLEALRALGTPVLVSLGGSAQTPLRTPTSDTDFFALGPPDALSLAGRLVRGLPRTDLETRGLDWLDALAERLHAYRPPVNGGPSPFAFMDLRFLARILHGQVVLDTASVRDRLEPLREPLRVALATYLSTSYAMVYEDAVGLFLAQRPLEILPIAGELAQRACLLALLQTRLVEPSSKWALTLAATTGDARLAAAARRLNLLLGTVDPNAPLAWARTLLRLCNAVVALGRLGGEVPPFPASAEDDDLLKPEWCLLGIPDQQVLLDTKENTLHVWNRPWLARLAASAEAEQA